MWDRLHYGLGSCLGVAFVGFEEGKDIEGENALLIGGRKRDTRVCGQALRSPSSFASGYVCVPKRHARKVRDSLAPTGVYLAVPWSYTLPPERIAQYPVEPRHESRLLIYRRGTLCESRMLYLADFLPEGTRLFYNDTRVVPARLRQGKYEILLTEIVEGGWAQSSPQQWKGLFRPGRFWRKNGELTWQTEALSFCVRWEGSADARQGLFWAEWTPPSLPALKVLETFGEVPLPPYLNRSPEKEDTIHYQTFYARQPGSVAAPTAGLHFTPEVWERLAQKGISTYPLTLHVGLGTFLPVADPTKPETHPMHAESFYVPEATLTALQQAYGPIACVGTTTLRTLESLYWIGAQLLQGTLTETPPSGYFVSSLCWKELAPPSVPPKEALQALTAPIHGQTQLYILPGYPFQVADLLLTNFHQPQSTLLSLVEAFLTEEGIAAVYTYALEKGFRFLSYGDASLLWRI